MAILMSKVAGSGASGVSAAAAAASSAAAAAASASSLAAASVGLGFLQLRFELGDDIGVYRALGIGHGSLEGSLGLCCRGGSGIGLSGGGVGLSGGGIGG